MRTFRIIICLTAAVAFGVVGLCLEASSNDGTSEKFAMTTYMEQAGNVTVFVDSFPASMHGDDAYVPVNIAIGLTAGGNLTVTPESFHLFDREGHGYPAASYGEILAGYDGLSFDAVLVRRRPIVVGHRFALSQELPSSFYPYMGEGIRVDNIHLAPYTWFQTVLYFPRPAEGLAGVMTLEVSGAGLESPMYVKFRVPARGRAQLS